AGRMEDPQLDMDRRQAAPHKVTANNTPAPRPSTRTLASVEAEPCSKTIGPLYDLFMSDFIPKAAEVKTRGLSPKAQKLQALREKAAKENNGGNPVAGASTA